MIETKDKAMVHLHHADGTITNSKGEVCTKFSEPGYWELNGHFYHIRGRGNITHTHCMGGGIICKNDHILCEPDERPRQISKDEFENELHNAMIELGLGAYFKK